jgi:predicted ribosome quality control (RQC) complex YloA/Tae2 family protein
MNDETIREIVEEIAPVLVGCTMGKVFQLARQQFAVDFRNHHSAYLFLSVEPQQPRLYMIRRRVREIEKQSLAPSPFALALRKQLAGARLVSLTKDAGDRIVRFAFEVSDVVGDRRERTLVAQLTGRASNLLLLDERGYVIDTLRPPRGAGQEIGDRYQPPPLTQASHALADLPFARGSFDSLSEAADNYYQRLEAARLFDARAAAARARLRKEITQRTKLRKHLASDLAAHGDAGEHKRVGDLLLANLSTAKRIGNSVTLTDYYAENAPQIELEVDEHTTLQEEASRRFARYTKARRAAKEIAERLDLLASELDSLDAQQSELEHIIAERDEAALDAFTGEPKEEKQRSRKQKSPENVPGARRYRSSDGYEIMVGRTARDNDHLTFRVARPSDLWLHAADYPGSHVIVRNPTRAEIPHRTIIEAAQLAAAFSQARRDSKVDVHYTQRKFLAKPKGAAPGLVRMSSFRSIAVEPRESVERI